MFLIALPIWFPSRGVTTPEKWSGKLAGGALQGRGSIGQWGAQGFNGNDIVLAAEMTQVMAFAPRGALLGSERKLL